jgi:hypothetical protein
MITSQEALLHDERQVFDRLVDQPFMYVHAGTIYLTHDAFDAFLVLCLMSHEEKIGVLEKMLKVSMRVDGELDPL